MKRILGIVAFGIVSLGLAISLSFGIGIVTNQRASAADFVCPEPTGLFGIDPCGRYYYSCDVGVPPMQMTCTEGTVFNQLTPTAGLCDYPFVMSQCGGSDAEFTCPAEDGVFPAGDCKQFFYNCAGGQAWQTNCPPTTVFEETGPGTGNCQYPFDVQVCES